MVLAQFEKIVLGIFFILFLFLFGCTQQQQQQADPRLCENNQIDSGEPCDGTNFGELTCQTFGFTGGELACNRCFVDVTGCNNILLASRPEKQPIVEQECISPTGLVGKTGGNAGANALGVYYNWHWDWRNALCFFDDLQNPSEDFCDSTQFTINLMKKLEEMNNNSVDHAEFYANLVEDGLSEDFKKDFYSYYKNIAFLDASSYYHNNLQDLLLDEGRLKFVNEINAAGVHHIIVSKNGEQWVIESKFLQDPPEESAFYRFPVDGQIGLTPREGESTANRIGYGVGFSGDPLVFSDFTISDKIYSDRLNVVVKKDFSFAQTNLEKRSHIIELDLQKGELNVLNSNPNLFMVDFSSLPQKAKENGAPFVVLEQNGKDLVSTENFSNYSNWYFLSSPNACTDSETRLFGKTIIDAKLANSACGFNVPDSSKQLPAQSLPTFKNSNAVVGTIFYSNQKLELSGLCGTQFIPVSNFFFSQYQPVSNAVISRSSPLWDIEPLSLSSDIRDKEKCVYTNDDRTVVYWNEPRFVNNFPDCVNCHCMNSERISGIAQTGFKPAIIRANSSVSFWVQFDEKSPISQPDIELFVTTPNGQEQKIQVAFFDDGQNNDFRYSDGIYGGTILGGFSETGKYNYYFKAKDVFGNEMQSKPAEFGVLEKTVCEITHNSGGFDKKLNIFVVGDNWQPDAKSIDDYKTSANFVKDDFLLAKPANDFASAFNFVTVGQLSGINCSSEEYTVPGETQQSQFIRCDSEKVVSAATSCGLPFKQGSGAFSDKIVVLHNGNFRANAELAGSIARVSSNPNWNNADYGFGWISVHELGHTFGLLDLYHDVIGNALGLQRGLGTSVLCENSDATNCIMCEGPLSSHNYDCTTQYRYNCNMSVNLPLSDLSPIYGILFGVCPQDQREMNDYEYMRDLFSKIGVENK